MLKNGCNLEPKSKHSVFNESLSRLITTLAPYIPIIPVWAVGEPRAQDRSDLIHRTDLLISWVLIASSCPFSLVSQAQCIPDVSRWLVGQSHSWLGAPDEKKKGGRVRERKERSEGTYQTWIVLRVSHAVQYVDFMVFLCRVSISNQ